MIKGKVPLVVPLVIILILALLLIIPLTSSASNFGIDDESKHLTEQNLPK